MQNLGRYEIIEKIGAGAMGAVYRARDPMMDREVAIKTILAQALDGPEAAEFRERFFREAKAAGRLTHPGIVTVYDVAEHEGTPFLVMEYIVGRTLHSMLTEGERMDMRLICDLGVQLTEALNYAHENGVIHRDIKPANILVTKEKRTKIADFGIAKLAEVQATTTGHFLGTPTFMAPEQFTGAQLDGRADLFAVGVVLYWMATGDKPFTGETVVSIQYKIVHTAPIEPRKLNPAISRDFEALLLKSLQKDPAERYQSGEEFAKDLRSLRQGRAVAATPAIVSGDDPTIPIARPPAVPIPTPEPPLQEDDRLLRRTRRTRRRNPVVTLIMMLLALVWFFGFGFPRLMRNRSVPRPVAGVIPEEPHPAATLPPPKSDIAPPVAKENVQAPPQKRADPPATNAQPVPEPQPEPPPLETLSAEEKQTPARGNRNLIGSPLRQRELARSRDSSRLLITSPAVMDFVTVIVRADGELLYRRDATTPPPGNRAQLRGTPTVPFTEERVLPPGEHRLQVTVLMGQRRIGQVEEVAGQFGPGQRRTLNIQFIPSEAQRAGGVDRGGGRIDVTLQ